MKVYLIYSPNTNSKVKKLTFSKEEAEKEQSVFCTFEEIEIDEHRIPTETLEKLQEILIARKVINR